MSGNGSYWDSPGAQAAEAANKASNADDYWGTPVVKEAMRESSILASTIVSINLLFKVAPRDQWTANMGKKLDEAKVSALERGYVPKIWDIYGSYVRLLDIVAKAGKDWQYIVEPSVLDNKWVPTDFVKHCTIVWYFDANWDAWCSPWDVSTVTEALRRYA